MGIAIHVFPQKFRLNLRNAHFSLDVDKSLQIINYYQSFNNEKPSQVLGGHNFRLSLVNLLPDDWAIDFPSLGAEARTPNK